LQQARSFKLVQGQADQLLIYGYLELVVQNLGHCRPGRLPVTVAPDQSGGSIQAVSFVVFLVIDQRFLG